MKLNRFLEMLSEVELSQHVFGDADEQGKLINSMELIGLINRGLEDIHTRFMLKKGELYLNVDTSRRTRYDITDESLILTPDVPLNVIKILEVWDECGNKQHLGRIHRSKNCMFMGHNEIELLNQTTLSFNCECGTYYIVFHQGPELIERPKSIEEFQPERIELDIPLEFVDALIYYICSRLYAINLPMEGYAAPYSPSVTYLKKYEEEIQRLKDFNMDIDGVEDTSHRFYDSTFP